nr:hypothetical protein [Tanacetum cinerariifolium]
MANTRNNSVTPAVTMKSLLDTIKDITNSVQDLQESMKICTKKLGDKNGSFKVFDKMPILEKINQERSVREYFDAFTSCHNAHISWTRKIGFNEWCLVSLFMSRLKLEIEKRIRFFNPKTLREAYLLANMDEATNELSKKQKEDNRDHVEADVVMESNDVNGVIDNIGLMGCDEKSDEKSSGKHDETRDGKSNEFVHFDGKKEELELLDENEEEEDCSIEEIKSNGVADITGEWMGVGELCKEDGKVKRIQSKNRKDNGYVLCGNRGMLKVAWKPLLKMQINGRIMGENSADADCVVLSINESVVSGSINEVKLVFKGST